MGSNSKNVLSKGRKKWRKKKIRIFWIFLVRKYVNLNKMWNTNIILSINLSHFEINFYVTFRTVIILITIYKFLGHTWSICIVIKSVNVNGRLVYCINGPSYPMSISSKCSDTAAQIVDSFAMTVFWKKKYLINFGKNNVKT